MRPSANWQLLLINHIQRGLFFMNPHIAIGMGKYFQDLLSADNLQKSLEREDYQLIARHYDTDESYSRYDDAPEGSTAIFSIKGPMLKYGTWWSYGTEEIAAFILTAVHHKNISSIVLDIDSGGGHVSAVSPINHAVSVSRAIGKPIVASVDMACSAAFWNAVDCDLIIANNNISSEVGSIGVMMEFWDLIPYFEKEGFKRHVIYADQSEHKNEAFELALQGKYDLIKKEMLNPLAIAFQNHVRLRRAGKLDESVPGILSGKIFFAEDSIKYGLIDEKGDITVAIERAQQLAESRKFLQS